VNATGKLNTCVVSVYLSTIDGSQFNRVLFVNLNFHKALWIYKDSDSDEFIQKSKWFIGLWQIL